jgi:hypothetical protein
VRLLWAIWLAVQGLPGALAKIEWKLGKIMGVLEDVDAQVGVIEQAVTDIEATEQQVAEAATAIEQKLAGLGLSPAQQDALAADVQRMRDATGRLGTVKSSLSDVTTGLTNATAGGTPAAPVPSSTAAATVTQPAAPDVAGEGVTHPDGSVAPDENAPPVGTTEVVQ